MLTIEKALNEMRQLEAEKPPADPPARRMQMDESIRLSLEILQEYRVRFPRWVIAWSGGKDSTATLTFCLWAIASGQVEPPAQIHVLYADTGMELPPLYLSAMDTIEQIELKADTGEWPCPVTVEQVQAPMELRLLPYILGRGVPCPTNRMRWCTDKLKVTPMQEAMNRIVRSGDAGTADEWLMITGVRIGESAARDQRIVTSCNADGSECGQGRLFLAAEKTDVADRLAPLAHWRVCHVGAWLLDWATQETYGDWDTALLVEAYGADEASELFARTGCSGCTVVAEDRTLNRLVVRPGWDHLEPMTELRGLLWELRAPKHRLRKPPGERNKHGAYAVNQNRMGPLTFAARRYGLARILHIETTVNALASRTGRRHIQLLSDEERDFIVEQIEAGVWPEGWDGTEPMANAPFEEVRVEGDPRDPDNQVLIRESDGVAVHVVDGALVPTDPTNPQNLPFHGAPTMQTQLPENSPVSVDADIQPTNDADTVPMASLLDGAELADQQPRMNAGQFPAILGRQGGALTAVFSLTLREFAGMRNLIDVGASPMNRAQRVLTRSRASKIRNYLQARARDFILPPVLMVVDLREASGWPHFAKRRRPLTLGAQSAMEKIQAIAAAALGDADREALLEAVQTVTHDRAGGDDLVGVLTLPMGMTLRLLDGQHRHAGVTALQALMWDKKVKKDARDIVRQLLDFTITIELRWPARLSDVGEMLALSQRWFRDVNHLGQRVSGSLSVAYNHDDPWAVLARRVAEDVFYGEGRIEYERTSVSKKSTKWFPLKKLAAAVKFSARGLNGGDPLDDAQTEALVESWKRIAYYMPRWTAVGTGMLTPQQVRESGLALHAISLEIAADLVGVFLQEDWREDEEKQRTAGRALRTLDLSRTNAEIQRRVLPRGKVDTTAVSVRALQAYARQTCEIPLTPTQEINETKLDARLPEASTGEATS